MKQKHCNSEKKEKEEKKKEEEIGKDKREFFKIAIGRNEKFY